MARPQVHECRNCGAPLGIPEDHERYFRCRSCGSVLEDVSDDRDRESGRMTITVADHAPVDVDALQAYAGPARTVGRVIAATSIVTLVAAVGVAALAFSETGGDTVGGGAVRTADGDSLQIFNYASAQTVTSDDDTRDDIAAVARTSDGTQLVYVDLDDVPALRWSTALAVESDTATQLLATPELVVATEDAALVARRRDSGAEVWRAALTDVVDGNLCDGCLAAFGDGIVTLTADGQLSSHSLGSGEQLWSQRLTEVPRQVVAIGGDPAVLDTSEDAISLHVFAATNGTLVERLPVSCPDLTFGGRDAINLYTHLFAVPDGTVVAIADPSFGGCAQRWGPGSGGAPMWESAYELPRAFSLQAQDVVVGETSLTIAVGTTIDVIDLASGAIRRVAEIPDVELVPIGGTADTVVVGAETTRGTSSWAVQAIDLAAGQMRWTFPIQATEWVPGGEGFAFSSPWSSVVTGADVAVVQQRGDEEALVVQTIPLGSGTPGAPATIPLGTGFSAPAHHGWAGGLLTVSDGGRFLVIDGTRGVLVADGP